MSAVTITLPGEPLAKGRPRFGANKNVYTPKRTVNYERDLGWQGKAAMAGKPKFTGTLRVSVMAFFKIPKRTSKAVSAAMRCREIRPGKKPDCDNILKMLDALNGIVWIDDSQIVDQRIQKFYSDIPELVVEVSEIGPPQ